MTKYFKLGKQATSFVCAKSGLAIANKNIVAINEKKIRNSDLVKSALANGHIVESTEDEFNKFKAGLPPEAVSKKPIITPDAGEGGEGDDDDDDAGNGEGDAAEEMAALIQQIKDHPNAKKSDKKKLDEKTKEELEDILESLED